MVREGENVRLRCAATGNPRPTVQWRKWDKTLISLGKWQGDFIYSFIICLFNKIEFK